jgi:hypothetical protein
LLLDVFSAIERREDQRFRDLVDPDFEIHWPPSLPYGGTARGPRPGVPSWSETWGPLQPTELERNMDAADSAPGIVVTRVCEQLAPADAHVVRRASDL